MRPFMAETTLKLHERITFDLDAGQVLDGPRRYLFFRTDVLMGAFDALPGPAREQALTALGQSVTRLGSGSVQAYLAEVGPSALLKSMEQASASLGWGVWKLTDEGDELHLEVRNSPFATATTRTDGPACHPITGMLTAVANALWKKPGHAREVSCACQASSPQARCLFRAYRQGDPGTGTA